MKKNIFCLSLVFCFFRDPKSTKTILLILAFILAMPSFGQDAVFSSNTKALLLQVNHLSSLKSSPAQVTAELKQFYPVRIIENQIFIGALIKVTTGIDERSMADLGVKINSRVNNIWSVMIPLSSLEKLKNVKGLIFVEADCRIKLKLDNATTESKVKMVQAGTGLSRKYLGDSVVIGVVDGGFDYTHPTFYDTTGANLRIVRSWEQENSQGPPPTGFNYGTEFSTTQALLDKKSSNTTGNHGCHVAGIAGGSGYLIPGKQYMGVAPAASLVFVDMSEAPTSVQDGINYIFTYAASVGRPAVVNLSLGTHIGPHDGTSLMDQAIDGLVGPGKIVAGAAGNEGDTPLHIYHAFSNDTVRTFMNFEESDAGGQVNEGTVENWGSAGSDFSLSLSFSDQQGTVLFNTPFYAASSNPAVDANTVVGSDTLTYKITGIGSSPLNQKPNLQAQINRKSNSYRVSIILASSNSQVNLWNHGTGTGASLYDTLNGVTLPNYTKGDNVCTIGEIGGTSKKIITVGAYTTKHEYVNINGATQTSTDSLDHLASFSSRGPTVDLRTKPEITAPGEMVVSAVNSYSSKYDENNSSTVLKVEQGATKWYFAAMQGTSMATPMTAGIIALMLQASPLLGPDQVKQMLQNNARTDSYTGTIGPNGSNDWGWGKIDAQKSVLAASGSVGIESHVGNDITAFPNPSRGVVFLKNPGTTGQTSEISVQNMIGATVYRQSHAWRNNELLQLDLTRCPDGMYLIIVLGDQNLQTRTKILINR